MYRRLRKYTGEIQLLSFSCARKDLEIDALNTIVTKVAYVRAIW